MQKLKNEHAVVHVWRGLAGAALLAGLAAVAQAGGGAHVVDDADLEDPGRCHVESWVTGKGSGRGLANLGLACTPASLPFLELGMATQYERDHADHGLTVGPAFKWNLLPTESGLGVTLAGNAQWNTRRDRLDSGALLVPLTLPITKDLKLNANLGWSHVDDSERRDALFRGIQVEYALNGQASLMAETFRRQGDPTGYQAGLRLTPGAGNMDVDLLYGHYVDGSSVHAYTLGLTWRY